jgi:hypothetical protein
MSSLDFDLDGATRPDMARERLDRIEVLKSRIMARMERHEDNAPVQDWPMGGGNHAAQISAMKDRVGDAELSAEHLERRWFAAMAAVKSLQDDCDALLRTVGSQGWGASDIPRSEYPAADIRRPAATAVRSSGTVGP